ncbi:hypothetical protein SSP24_77300 [Streptomyces spinoverrucosus]|uniref:Gram-positive cocci surface proteins LPxTG domain-containing protein n=1 Tax=Streptomyces spinoverrucosus TaxID=284043 RepID=A0A4Y3VVE2_9ACTN|nr:hypothetical protein [Streptomyces spinoverrucosus]GEC10075.1 hypothetical protein SSP24_77300 [Streptomyces spinoverrucosus]GHB70848.1 hypothetical protein GCM10010397_46440 [Streptomyces spinoverrucosus]
MRLCTPVPLSLCLAAAALLGGAASPVHAAAAGPDCAASDNRQFPITTRIHGGPESYDAGGGYGMWSIDLTNTTQSPCTGIHPVVVLVDGERALKPTQPRLEFYEGARPRPVRFERTDQDELVGAFGAIGDGFAGFAVPPGQTLTVRVRLAMTSDAVPNDVTANAAVVQRREDDGDWVGQSNDYRFRVRAEGEAEVEAEAESDGAVTPDDDPSAVPDGRLSFADELAGTGLITPHGALVAASFLLVVIGGALVVVRRRR